MNSGFTGTKLHVTNTVVREERLMLNATENGKIYADMDHMLQTLRIAVHYLCNGD